MARAKKTPAPVTPAVVRSAKKAKTTVAKTASPGSLNRRTKATPASEPPSVQDIAERAYDLFVQEGGVHGHDIEHWLQAERLLLQEPVALSKVNGQRAHAVEDMM